MEQNHTLKEWFQKEYLEMNGSEERCSILSAMLTEKQIHRMENTFPLEESFRQCQCVYIWLQEDTNDSIHQTRHSFFIHLVLQFHLQLSFLRHPIRNIAQKKKEQGRYWRDTTWYTT